MVSDMKVYQLSEIDVSDLLALITSQSLAINAAQAQRVAQLQVLLSEAKPLEYRSEEDYAAVLERWKRAEAELASLANKVAMVETYCLAHTCKQDQDTQQACQSASAGHGSDHA